MTQMPQAPNPYGNPAPSPQEGYAPPPPKVTSGYWYLLPLLCLIVGAVGTFHYGKKAFTGLLDVVESMQDLNVPGTSRVTIPAAGTYSVYLFPDDDDDFVPAGQYKAEIVAAAPGLSITVTEVDPQKSHSEVSYNDETFLAYWQVEADGAGDVEITILPSDPSVPPTPVEASFGIAMTGEQIIGAGLSIAAAVGFAIGGGLLALVLFVVVLVIRSNSKGRLRQHQMSQGGGW